jgi:hypothetical protein
MIHPHDPGMASAASVNGSIASEDAAIDTAFLLLMVRGFSAVEASNVVAYITGLHPAESGWTVEEIKRLVAIRSLVARGFIGS